MALPHWSNYLSLIRTLTALLICAFAWQRYESWYLSGLVILLGLLATGRALDHLRRPLERNAGLASAADFATFIAVLGGGWLLFPHLIVQERAFVGLVVIAYIASTMRPFFQAKNYRHEDSVSAKLLPILLATSVLAAFVTNNTWGFRVFAVMTLFVTMHQFSGKKK